MTSGVEILFIVCAAIGTLFTFATVLAGRFGGRGVRVRGGRFSGKLARSHGVRSHARGRGSGAKANGNSSLHDVVSIPFVSPVTGAMFLGSFGFLGFIARSLFAFSSLGSIAFAAPLGFGSTLLMFWLFVNLLVSSQGSSLVSAEEAAGLRATVVTTIDGKRLGSISYVHKGKRLTMSARAEDDVVHKRGDEVFISRTDGPLAFVRRDRAGLWSDES